MRIRRVAFEAFGPYRDRQEIDFDQLGDSGLYLINGPTGAGKSTIIDAICYALFAKLANDDADIGRVRSDFAEPTDQTSVELVFDCAAGTFRVTRSPEYYRPKKKGDTGALTRSHAQCRVYRLNEDGSEKVVADRVSSAAAELATVVGLTKEQFVQTVVLPQGKFATFLTADTQNREKVLKQIFDTRLFELVVAGLSARAALVRKDIDDLTVQVDRSVRELADTLGCEGAIIDQWTGFVKNSLDDPLLEALAAFEPQLIEAVEAAQNAVRQAKAEAEQADIRRTLARDEKAARSALEQANITLAASKLELDVARKALSSHEAVAATLDIDVTTTKTVTAWRNDVTLVAEVIGRLRAMIDAEADVLSWPEDKRAAEQHIAELHVELTQAEHDAAGIPERIVALESITKNIPTATEFDQLHQSSEEIKQAQRHIDELVAAQAELTLHAELLRELEKDALAAGQQLDELGRAYRSGIAGYLAQDLVPDQPCAVCGSTAHPAPAQMSPEAVSYERLDEARFHSAQRDTELQVARDRHESARTRVELKAADITMTDEEVIVARTSNEALRAQLDRRTTAAKEAEITIAQLRKESDELSERIKALSIDLTTDQTQLRQRSVQMDELTRQVQHERGAFASVTERVSRLERLQEALEQTAHALQQHDLAAESVHQAGSILDGMNQHEHFGDVAQAETAWQEATNEKSRADQSQILVDHALTDYRRRLKKITEDLAARKTTSGSSIELLHLLDVFDAGRGSNFGLHIYVLRLLFDNVMALANQRFESLLQGRYRLVAADSGDGDGRSRQGLGVNVLDAFTEKVRSAKSLSGGEMFCASLALALGLSDAVRMNAGGISIHSLFIDEGFGSLDSDQLDDVMHMLSQLSRHGQRVGLISHVDSMKETIVERINVVPATMTTPASLTTSWMT